MVNPQRYRIPPEDAPAHMPSVPSGATPIQTRSIRGFTFGIFAWPTRLPVAKVELDWVLTYPQDAGTSSSQDKLGPSVERQSGIVGLGGAYGPSTKGLQDVRGYQVTLPSIAAVRVVDGKKVLDSMSPATFDGVRFAVHAAVNMQSLKPLLLQGLDASGAVVYSDLPQSSLSGWGACRAGGAK